MCYLVRAICVNSVDEIPVLVLHVLEADITQDTSVVQEDIHTTEVLDSRVDDGFPVLDAVVVGGRLAAGSSDLVDHDVRSLYAKHVSIHSHRKQGGNQEGYSKHTFDELPSPE